MAYGLVADGTSTAVLIYRTHSQSSFVISIDPSSGAKLYPWNPQFLNSTLLSMPTLRLPFDADSLFQDPVTGDYYGLALVEAPAPITIEGLTAQATITIEQVGFESVQTTLRIVPRPIILIHGLWGSPTTFDSISDYLVSPERHLPYIDITDGESEAYPVAGIQQFAPILRVCYSKSLAFDAAPASPPDSSCSGPSVDVLNAAFRDIYAFLNKEGVVGGRVDVIAHSMGGLVARAYALQRGPAVSVDSGYTSIRDRQLGKFYSLFPLDTPHLGSALADFLVKAAQNHYGASLESATTDANVVWTAAQCLDGELLTDCYDGIDQPISTSADTEYSHGSVASLTTTYPALSGTTAYPLAIPGVFQTAVASEFDPTFFVSLAHPFAPEGNSTCPAGTCGSSPVTPSILRQSIDAFISAVAPTPTLSTFLLGAPNDVVVTVMSQLGGMQQASDAVIQQTAHSGLSWIKLEALQTLLNLFNHQNITYSDENVLESANVHISMLCFLVSPATCTHPLTGPDVARPAIVASINNQLLEPSQAAQTMESQHRRMFDANDRVIIKPQNHVVIGDNIELPLLVQKGVLKVVIVTQSALVGNPVRQVKPEQAPASVPILYRPNGEAYVQVAAQYVGNVRLQLQGFFEDGGHWNQAIDIMVRPRESDLVGFWLNPADAALSMDNKRPFGFQAYARYKELKQPVKVDTSFIQLRLRNAGTGEVVRLDRLNGTIVPMRVGHALLEAFYAGMKSLTCVVVVPSVDEIGGKQADCSELALPGEKLPYRRQQVNR